jgi:signal peptidase I
MKQPDAVPSVTSDPSHRSSQSSQQHPRKQENGAVELAKTLGLSLLLAFGIRQFLADARFIPTGSMLPTLQIDDRLLVDKVTYRFQNPQRGDIVVFNSPYNFVPQLNLGGPTPQTDWGERLRCTIKNIPLPFLQYNSPACDAFIKRIIGMPGDQVAVQGGKVFINGQPLKESYVPPDYRARYAFRPTTVPAGHYLVLGDNRNNSFDGHFWGFVPRDQILGKAMVRFWPFNRLGAIQPLPNYGPIPDASAATDVGLQDATR